MEQVEADTPALKTVETSDMTGNPRWAIRLKQLAAGEDPCFATHERHGCTRDACPYRALCVRVSLRADWLR